ncbi:MAG TPA: murein biosynthesis integral membrane protein MurJ [Solirubrobacteraceae bacterium]|jgi:putative peptidoglycan lipid II flippase|nr:murein biosynthesis integral membrane protein MurJ [Solirubrobacteraceae bacterium]
MAAETRAEQAKPGRIARNTAIFSILTGLSRVAGLIREIVASSYFGTSGPFSAFTIAFQVPNLVRNLFADAALSAAFVPVFTELLEKGRRREAFQLASTFVVLIVAALTAISVFFILVAPYLMPLMTGDDFTPESGLDDLTIGLSQVLFPIVLLLGLNGLLVGILNAYDHFTIQALAPLAWNFVIIGLLVVLRPLFSGAEELYAYAIAVLAGTIVQLAMTVPVLRRLDFRFERRIDLRDPRVKQVLALMLPVTLSLGLINFNMLINSALGSSVSAGAPRAIDAAFRIYMLPQGMFSVAVATVLFPALSRLATRRDFEGLRELTATGTRQIFLLLIPAAACTLALAVPITRLVYERGEFDADSTRLVAEALFWFSFSLPFAGANLLLTRTFFSLQRPWLPTAIGGGSLVINAIVAVALYQPFGVGGIVVGTAVASAAMMAGQVHYLRRELGGRLGGRATIEAVVRILAASALLAAVAYGLYRELDSLVGRSLPGQLVSVGGALTASIAGYAWAVLALRVPEAQQIRDAIADRLRRRRS